MPAAAGQEAPALLPGPGLGTVLREWGRIGCIGFGGPPAHIRLLRELCVEREHWLDAAEFEDAIAACNLLPGPASTQLAIFCAWRVRGRAGALAGGAAFIVPGLIVILALAALFLSGSPPLWVLGAGAGAGAAVPSWATAARQAPRRTGCELAQLVLVKEVEARLTMPFTACILVVSGDRSNPLADEPRQRLDFPLERRQHPRGSTGCPTLSYPVGRGRSRRASRGRAHDLDRRARLPG